MKLHLNLATAPEPNKRPFLAGAAVLGTIAVIALALLSLAAYHSWQSSRELRAEIAGRQEEIRRAQDRQRELQAYFRSPGAQQVLERSAFLNSLIDERSFPWTKVFMDLENTIPPGVRVVSITPRLVNGHAELTLEVGAINDESKIHFLETMEQSKIFTDMVVKDERRSEQSATADKIMLNLTVWYENT